jgi:ABC-type antimicrobial peptide transport system permease subunit
LLRNSVDTGLFIDDAGVSVPTLLLTLGLLVLIVACVNYANLATARAARRTREVGLRKALGADRAQIARQYLFEAGALTSVALVLALAAFRLAAPLLRAIAGVDVTPALFAGPQFWGFLGAVIAGVTLATARTRARAGARAAGARCALRANRSGRSARPC